MRMDRLEDEWTAVQRESLAQQADGDLDGAARVVEAFLKKRKLPEYYLSEGLAMRADIHESAGHFDLALVDLQAAHKHSKPNTYARYTIELTIGRLLERSDRRDEAASWYRKALQTCSHGKDASCGAALRALLAVSPILSREDHALAERAVKQSWLTLGVSRPPVTENLSEVAQLLHERESTPPKG